MSTFMMVWNPKLWDGDPEFWSRRLRLAEFVSAAWDTGNRISGVDPGDSMYLVKTGEQPLGVMARGTVISEMYDGPPHLAQDQDGPPVKYVDVKWDSATSKADVLPRDLLKRHIPENGWRFQTSGNMVDEDVATRLEVLWAAHPQVQHGQQGSEVLFDDLVEACRGAEPEWSEGWRRGKLGAKSVEAVDHLSLAPGAPESLALLALVLGAGDIGSEWTLSCLPTGTGSGRRAYTLSRGLDEVMYVDLTDDGHFEQWTVVIDTLGESAARRLGFVPSEAAGNRTSIAHVDPWALVAALADLALSDAIVTALRSQGYRGQVRQANRHNETLAAVIAEIATLVPPNGGGTDEPDDEVIDEEVVRAYRKYEAKRRLHQAKFRALLLKNLEPPRLVWRL